MQAGSRANDCVKINVEERRKNKKASLRKRKGERNAHGIKAKQRTEKYKKSGRVFFRLFLLISTRINLNVLFIIEGAKLKRTKRVRCFTSQFKIICCHSNQLTFTPALSSSFSCSAVLLACSSATRSSITTVHIQGTVKKTDR